MAPKRSASPNPTSSGQPRGSIMTVPGSGSMRMQKAFSEPFYRSDHVPESMVQLHFDIDPESGALKGAKKHERNVGRTVHDWFNIVALIPICVLNGMCWKWEKLPGLFVGTETFATLWSGAYFGPFFFLTLAYFLADVIWVIVVPSCVASPPIIIGHHIATLLYLLIPYTAPEYGWFMGACLSVEVNTWFLIARRVFNQSGKNPFAFQANTPGGPLNIKIISIFFYATWIIIRLMVYPALYFLICAEYGLRTEQVGSLFNIIMPGPALQAVFCYLNLKWSRDLYISKMRSKKGTKDKGGL